MSIKCHSFIVINTSEFFKITIRETNQTHIILDYDFEIINVVLNYLYTEKIVDKNLSSTDIIQLFDLINLIKCDDSCIQLEKYYIEKFDKLINNDNWFQLLKNIFNINKYIDLQAMLLSYYNSYILQNIDEFNVHIIKELFNDCNNGIKYLLFSICIDKMLRITNELKDIDNEKNIQEKKKMNNILKKLDIDDENKIKSKKNDDDTSNDENESINKKR